MTSIMKMMNKDDVVQMCIYAPEFKMPVRLDEDFTYVELTKYDREDDLKTIVDGIDDKLSDWEGRPDLENLKKRFKAGCSVFLQYYKGQVSGWFWTCDFLTYNWIEKVKELPTPNSNYSGGTYVIKSITPPRAGLQLYAYCIKEVMSRTDYGYAYVDKWNKASIRLIFNCGAHYVDNLL